MKWIMVIAFACRTPGSLEPEDLGESHAETPAVVADPSSGRLRYEMREQRHTLVDLEADLAAGRLDEVKALGFMLAERHRTLSTPAGSAVVTAARAMANARSIDEAKLAIPPLIHACNGCHPMTAWK